MSDYTETATCKLCSHFVAKDLARADLRREWRHIGGACARPSLFHRLALIADPTAARCCAFKPVLVSAQP